MLIINNWWEKRNETRGKVQAKFNQSSLFQATTIDKIILNSGVGQAINDKKFLESTIKALQQITGQKPKITKAKDSIITFKTREGMEIGCMVTLRGKKVYEFLFQLINIALPRVGNFRGLSTKSFDHHGNYNLGVRDLNIFPTVAYDLTFRNQGCQVTIVFKSRSVEENSYYLSSLGFPFQPKEKR